MGPGSEDFLAFVFAGDPLGLGTLDLIVLLGEALVGGAGLGDFLVLSGVGDFRVLAGSGVGDFRTRDGGSGVGDFRVLRGPP